METNGQPQKKPSFFQDNPFLVFLWAAALVILTFTLTLTSRSNTDSSSILASYSYEALVFIQLISVIALLVAPALLMGFMYKRNLGAFFQVNKMPKLWEVVLVIVLIISCNLFLNFLVELNEMIPLSGHLQNKLKAMQDSTTEMQYLFLDFKNVFQFILAFTAMAVFPAFAEELYFRGLLMGVLKDMKLNVVHVIFISSVLFAMMHFQFYFFLALLFMGMVLGFIYYYSGNLWLSMIAHFVNNGLLVVFTATNKLKVSQIDLEANPPTYLSLIGFVVFLGAACMFYKMETKKVINE